MSNLHQPKPNNYNQSFTPVDRTSSAPLDKNQFNATKQKNKLSNPNKKKMNIAAKNFDFGAPQENSTSSNNFFDGFQAQPQQTNFDFSQPQQQNLPKLTLKKKLKKPTTTAPVLDQLPNFKNQPQQQVNILNDLAPNSKNAEELKKQKEEDEKKRKEEEEKRKKEEEEKRIKEEEEKKYQEELEKRNVPITMDFINEWLNKKDLVEKVNYFEKDVKVENYLERSFKKVEISQLKPIKKQYSQNQQNRTRNSQYQGNTYNPNNQNNLQKQESFKTGVITQKPHQKKGRYQKEKEVPIFMRQQEDASVVLAKDKIESAKNWTKEKQKDNENENVRIAKDIKFQVQTLSPDNVDAKLLMLIKHESNPYGREQLIEQLIEKACVSTKYVTTYADLIYKIINHPQATKNNKGKALFKNQLLEKVQQMFDKKEILDKKKPLKEMTEAELDKYKKNKKEKLKQFTTFLGELYKVKIVAYKLVKILMSEILQNFLNTYMYQFASQKNKENLKNFHDEEKEDMYLYTNDHIEALINFIECLGSEIDKQEKAKNEAQIDDKQKVDLENMKKDLASKDENYKFNKYENIYNLEYYFLLLEYIREAKIYDSRIGALIMNLKQFKESGWVQGIKKQDSSAKSLAQVNKEHQQKLQESEQKAQEYYQEQNEKKERKNKEKVQYKQKSNNKQSSSKNSKEDNLKALEDDQRKENKEYQQVEKSIQMLVVQGAGSDEEKLQQKVDELISKSSSQLEVDVTIALISYSYQVKDSALDNTLEFISQALIKYYKQFSNQSQHCLYEILNKLFITIYSESSDFPFMVKAVGTILYRLRKEQLFTLENLKIDSQDDEDEDEEVVFFFEDVFKTLAKLAKQDETDLHTFVHELKEFQKNVKFACQWDENQPDLIVKSALE